MLWVEGAGLKGSEDGLRKGCDDWAFDGLPSLHVVGNRTQIQKLLNYETVSKIAVSPKSTVNPS